MAEPGITAQAPAVPTPLSLAFYTMGDPKLSAQIFQKRAEGLASAGKAYGVNTLAAAIQVVNSLPPLPKLSKVYFVGHGTETSFLLKGHLPDPKNPEEKDYEFIGDADLSTPSGSDENKQFLTALARHMDTNNPNVQIGFLCCYTGQSGLLNAVGNVLDAAGVQSYAVYGYKDYYYFWAVTNTNTQNILTWQDRIVDNEKTKKPVLNGGPVTTRPYIPQSQILVIKTFDPLPPSQITPQ